MTNSRDRDRERERERERAKERLISLGNLGNVVLITEKFYNFIPLFILNIVTYFIECISKFC
jgi:hypothetical protein